MCCINYILGAVLHLLIVSQTELLEGLNKTYKVKVVGDFNTIHE